jgi:haloalkane dehalogenase
MTTTTAPPVKTLTVAGGTRLGYREMGAGPAVLLVHGWPTSSFLWREVMPTIAETNRVLAIDLPGFGASDKPKHSR